jgi:hypothetical protein
MTTAVTQTCACGAYGLLTATGRRVEENAGAICRHTATACVWFSPTAWFEPSPSAPAVEAEVKLGANSERPARRPAFPRIPEVDGQIIHALALLVRESHGEETPDARDHWRSMSARREYDRMCDSMRASLSREEELGRERDEAHEQIAELAGIIAEKDQDYLAAKDAAASLRRERDEALQAARERAAARDGLVVVEERLRRELSEARGATIEEACRVLRRVVFTEVAGLEGLTLRGAERDDWLVRTTARKVLVRLLSSAPVAPRCPAGDPNCMCHAPMDPPPAAPGDDNG